MRSRKRNPSVVIWIFFGAKNTYEDREAARTARQEAQIAG